MERTPPVPIGIAMCQTGSCHNPVTQQEESKMNVTRIGLDLAKNVFQVHGVDRNERVVVRRRLLRGEVGGFFEKLSPCLIGMEACAAALLPLFQPIHASVTLASPRG
jgi:transposase